MLSNDVRTHFGIARDFDRAGNFETDANTKLIKELTSAVRFGHLIVVSGIIGSGKTSLLLNIQKQLTEERHVQVARSLAIEKERVSMPVLMNALFADLATERDFKPPTQAEKRERKLLELFKKARKPVALFIDDAHALHGKTLVSLKRLIELVRDNDSTLSVVLAGHPKLGNDLRRAALEEIGGRATILPMEGIQGRQRDYLEWLLTQCLRDGVTIEAIIDDAALDVLADRLATPLQIHRYLGDAFQQAHSIGQKKITIEIVTAVLSRDFDGVEAKLIREGYDAKVIAQLINTKPGEVRSFLHGHLEDERTEMLRNDMQKVGIPLF